MRRIVAAAIVVAASAMLSPAAAPPAALAADGTPFRAGQNVNFYASSARCTTAFVVRLGTGRRTVLGALTAGHCSRYPRRAGEGFARERVWRVRGRSSPPATNLGVTLANANRTGPDVLAFSVQGVSRVQQRIQRRGRPSLAVSGSVPTSRQRRGMRVCMTGRSSGTRCGRLSGVRRRSGSRRLVCATMRVRSGDSGGPVYTQPGPGPVKAVGIVKAARPGREGMCFTPIGSALSALNARLA